MEKINFLEATNEEYINTVQDLAFEIWNEHYTSIIGKTQVDYMLKKFQSKDVMLKQIDEGYKYYLIAFNDSFVGYIGFIRQDDYLFLSKIYIKSDYRGKGLGRKAIDFISTKASEYGLTRIQLTVNKDNLNSIESYKKFGFVVKEPIAMDIGNGFVMDDYVMEKSVADLSKTF